MAAEARYRFVTSSSRSPPPLNRYYAPINFINTRHWSSDRRYGPADARRDARMGGGDAIPIPFANGGNPIEMPNFMNFLPMPGYTGETLNGIHEIAGGLDSGGTFGAPVSLGCIRLKSSKPSCPVVPRLAVLRVLRAESYRHFGDAATGKARIQSPTSYSAPAASFAQATEVIIGRRSERTVAGFPLFHGCRYHSDEHGLKA